jgi:Flp pilus assembly protein CpaB
MAINKRTQWTAAAFGVVLFLLGVGLYQWHIMSNDICPCVERTTTAVVVAARPIAPGEQIDATMLETQLAPAQFLPPNYIEAKNDALIGQRLTVRIEKGQMILRNDVYRRENGAKRSE